VHRARETGRSVSGRITVGHPEDTRDQNEYSDPPALRCTQMTVVMSGRFGSEREHRGCQVEDLVGFIVPWRFESSLGDRSTMHYTAMGVPRATASLPLVGGGSARQLPGGRLRTADIVVAGRRSEGMYGDYSKSEACRIEGVRPDQSVEERIIIRDATKILRSTTNRWKR